MEIVKAPSTADFLAMVPTLAGMDVARSMVFVPFRGNRTLSTACRVDLPSRERKADIRAVLHGAIGVLTRLPGVDRVDVVLYTDRTYAGERGIPHLELGRHAVETLRRAGFHVGLAACVAADGWGEYLDRDHHDEGRPLSELSGSVVAAEVRARAPEGEELRGGDVPDADADERSAVARALAEPFPSDAEPIDVEREVLMVDLLDVVLEHYDEPSIAAAALHAFDSPATRDVALLHYAYGRDVGHRAAAEAFQLAAVQRETGRTMDEIVAAELEADPDGVDVELGDLLLGRTERIPDRARLVAAIGMLRSLVARAPDEFGPGPLTMLGWCLWAMGAASAAGAALERALRLDPDYRMAALLLAWVDAGAMPDWLFERRD